MNAVIYARYSPGPRQTDQSIEGQVRDCMEYAKAHDITVIDVYADRHISGTDFLNRKEFNRMVRDAEKKQFDYVLTWKVDRFGRDREEIVLNKVKLKRAGVRLIYAKEVIPDGPEGVILESLMEGLAEYYIEDLRQKVRRGQRENALKGCSVGGRPPLGYKLVEKKFTVDEHEAFAVHYIFEHFDSGESITSILKELQRIGVRNKAGHPITKNGVYQILRNQKYTGHYQFQDISIPIPALISEELFQSVQHKLVHRDVKPGSFKAAERYLLSMKVYCGECGALLVGECGYGKMKMKYHYYKCSTKKQRKKVEKPCTLKNYRKEELEDFVIQHTVQDVLRYDVMSYIADRVIELQKKDDSVLLLESLQESLAVNRRACQNLVRAMEQGIFSATTQQRLSELEAEKARLEADIARTSVKKPALTREHVLYWLECFKRGDTHDAGFCERLLDVFVHSVYVYSNKIVIVYNYADNDHTVNLSHEFGKSSDSIVELRFPRQYPNIAYLPDFELFALCVNL